MGNCRSISPSKKITTPCHRKISSDSEINLSQMNKLDVINEMPLVIKKISSISDGNINENKPYNIYENPNTCKIKNELKEGLECLNFVSIKESYIKLRTNRHNDRTSNSLNSTLEDDYQYSPFIYLMNLLRHYNKKINLSNVLEILKMVLSMGVDLNSTIKMGYETNGESYYFESSYLSKIIQLSNAYNDSKLEILKLILEQKPNINIILKERSADSLGYFDKKDYHIIYKSIKEKNELKIVRLLLKHNPDLNNVNEEISGKKVDGNEIKITKKSTILNSLIRSKMEDSEDLAIKCISQGADINIPDMVFETGKAKTYFTKNAIEYPIHLSLLNKKYTLFLKIICKNPLLYDYTFKDSIVSFESFINTFPKENRTLINDIMKLELNKKTINLLNKTEKQIIFNTLLSVLIKKRKLKKELLITLAKNLIVTTNT